MNKPKLKNIPGFVALKAFRHGRYWYILDCTVGAGDSLRNVIGGYFHSYGLACSFATEQYTLVYN